MSSNCASEFANVYTTISSISGNMDAYVSNVSSTYGILNQMVSNQSNINTIVYNSNSNINCGNIFANNVINHNGNVTIQNGNVNINNGSLLLNGKISLGGDYGSTGQVLVSNGNTLPSWRSSLTKQTIRSLAGTSVAFTNIPSWANEIIIMFVNASTNGTVVPRIEVGTSAGYSGPTYLGTIMGNNGAAASAISTGILLWNTTWSDTNVFTGIVRLHHIGGNVWGIQINTARSGAPPYASVGEGRVSVGGVLDRLRMNIGGGNSYDSGSVTIMYH